VKRASAGMQGLPGMLFERRWSAWFRGPLPSVFFFLLASPVAPVESCPAGQLRDSLGNCVPDPFGLPINLPPPPPPSPPPAESCPAGQLRDSLGNCVPDPFGFPTNLPTPPAPTPTPAPPGTIRPADPPTAPVVSVRRAYTLPFTVSETGSSEKSYEFSVASTTDVSVSLTGMDRDIDCSVNGFRCTNRGGTANDSWSGTLQGGTHTVSVYPYNADSGSWTLSVSGTSASPPPAPTPTPSPPGSPQPTCPSGYAYVASASRCERPQSFRMQAIEAGISSRQSYSFTLRSGSSVTVSLTGLTRDFDCTVGNSNCTNNWGSEDDSWSGTLRAGTHAVLVYPYGGGVPGDYTLTVAVNDVNLVSVVSPTGSGPEEIVCKDGDGNEVNCPTPDQVLVVVGEDPGPPPGTGPGEGDPPPNPNPNPDPNPGPTTPTSSVIGSLQNVVEATKLDCRGMNFEVNERLGTEHGGTNTTRTGHSGIDMNTKGVRSKFYAPVSGTLSYDDQDRNVDDDGNVTWGSGCGHYAKILRSDRTYVIICHLDPAQDVTPGTISAGDLIGKDGQTGHNSGPHLHLSYKRSVRDILNPFDLWGGNSSVENEGFSFDDSDPTTCEEPE